MNALLAMLLGLLRVTPNPDCFYLAMSSAAEIARKAGVTSEEWARVGRIVQRRYQEDRRRDPLSCLF